MLRYEIEIGWKEDIPPPPGRVVNARQKIAEVYRAKIAEVRHMEAQARATQKLDATFLADLKDQARGD